MTKIRKLWDLFSGRYELPEGLPPLEDRAFTITIPGGTFPVQDRLAVAKDDLKKLQQDAARAVNAGNCMLRKHGYHKDAVEMVDYVTEFHRRVCTMLHSG